MANVPVIWFIVTTRCDWTSGPTADWFVAISRQRVSHWHQTESEGMYRFTMGHFRYINLLTRLCGFQDKFLYFELFPLYLSLFWEFRDKLIYNFEPEGLGAMLEYVSNVACYYKNFEIRIKLNTNFNSLNAWFILQKYSRDRNSQFLLTLACIHHMHDGPMPWFPASACHRGIPFHSTRTCHVTVVLKHSS